MKKRGTGFAGRSSRRYLMRRGTELATAATRASTDPLAAWALKRIRLDGRPFSFEGHEYLRAIYDDTGLTSCSRRRPRSAGRLWAILRSCHACLQGLNVGYYFPTKTDVLEFSKSRVSPLLGREPLPRPA